MIDCIFPIYVIDEENERLQDECFATFNTYTERDDIRVIVIDNGSNLGVSQAQAQADIYVRLPEPVGYARAVNIGWKLTEALPDSEIVGVLNNDLTFTPGWLDALLPHLDEKTAAVAPYDHPQEGVTDHIWSSCFFMQAETRKRIGLFDADTLPWRYHDQDYWIRAKRLGLTFKRVGASQVGHRESSTYKKMPQRSEEAREEAIMRERWGVTMAQHYEAT